MFRSDLNDWLWRDPNDVFLAYHFACQRSFGVKKIGGAVKSYGAGTKHFVKMTHLIFTHLNAIRLWHGFFKLALQWREI